VKLSAGSDPIRNDHLLMTFDNTDFTTTLTYSNASDSEDYFTYGSAQPVKDDIITNSSFVYLRNDLTSDNIQERLRVNDDCDGILLDLRNGTTIDVSLAGVDMSNCESSSTNCVLSHSYTGSLGGTIYFSGTTQTNCALDSNVDVYSSSNSSLEGIGYFTIKYLQQSQGFLSGYIQKGDVIEINFASPDNVGTDRPIRSNVIPKIGIDTAIEFDTPQVITRKRVFLFP